MLIHIFAATLIRMQIIEHVQESSTNSFRTDMTVWQASGGGRYLNESMNREAKPRGREVYRRWSAQGKGEQGMLGKGTRDGHERGDVERWRMG